MSALPNRSHASLSTSGYSDGLGRRSVRFDREFGGMLEILELRPELVLYEPLLYEAATHLASITSQRIARVRSIEREGRALVVLSEYVAGERLEDILEARAADDLAGGGIEAALGFLHQALPAIRVLHAGGLVHGTIAPGRIALTQSGDVILLDCIYARAVERLRLPRQKLWTTMSLVAPMAVGATRFEAADDLRHLTLAALAIALGRNVEEGHKADAVARMLQEVTEVAQIRAGDRFAVDVRALLGNVPAAGLDAPPSLDELAADVERLIRKLGVEACRSALADLAAIRPARIDAAPPRPSLGIAESVLDRVPVRHAAPRRAPVDHTFGPISLDLDHAPLVVVDPSDDASSFDWKPEPEPVARRVESAPTPLPAPIAAPTPVAIVPDVRSSAPSASERSTIPPVAPVDPPLPASPGVPERAEREATPTTPVIEVAAQPEPPPVPRAPEPPPGIPLQGPVAPPAADPMLAPRPLAPAPTLSVGPKPFVPPPVVHAPVPTPAAPPPAAPVLFTPPPVVPVVNTPPPQIPMVVAPLSAPVPVQTPAFAPSSPLRLKTEAPAGFARPRKILDESSDVASDGQPHVGGFRRSPAAWKIAVAACIVVAVGAFAGRSYLDGHVDAPPAETATTAPPVKAEAATVGGLRVESQPVGATVLLDGEDVGRTPLQLDAIKPGRHTVTLTTESSTVKRTVRIEAGKVVNLDVAVYSGWVALYSPIPLHVAEGSRSLGTSDSTRIMLSPGRHELTLTNREFGYTTKESVDIVPGEERVLNVEPKGTVSVNALPWAEVWVDGQRMGDTPLANLEVPLGTREFVFKHPEHGERKLMVTVTSKTAPVSVDLTKPGRP